jgi:phosphate transport system regulatory protein PhoU
MNAHLRKDMEKLKSQILTLAALVEDNVRRSIIALRELSPQLAKDAVKADRKIDETEVEIEEECLKILALHQPVARDLRFVVTVLKINNELEHIGDMAANIAKRVPHILAEIKIPFDIDTMTSLAIQMLKNSLDAFLSADEILALKVCRDDDAVNDENRKCYINVEKFIRHSPMDTMAYLNYLLVCRSIERIGDLCTNIAEDVIYMKRSIIVRHNIADAEKQILQEK